MLNVKGVRERQVIEVEHQARQILVLWKDKRKYVKVLAECFKLDECRCQGKDRFYSDALLVN